MTLTITDTTMASGHTAHTARPTPDRDGWEVSWLPGQILDRNIAITAMTLAESVGETDLHEGHQLWPFIQSWAAELGLTAPDAITQASQRPPTSTVTRNQPTGSQAVRHPISQQDARPRSAACQTRPGSTA